MGRVTAGCFRTYANQSRCSRLNARQSDCAPFGATGGRSIGTRPLSRRASIVYSRWCRPLPMENENERSIIAAALDEALRDQVKRLFAVLTMSMVEDGGSNVARDKAEKRFTIGLKIVRRYVDRAAATRAIITQPNEKRT